jgi:hypothetical protein
MLTKGFVTDPDHWRERAEDMRLTASALEDEHAKARMLRIAEGYEALGRSRRSSLKSRGPRVNTRKKPLRRCTKP